MPQTVNIKTSIDIDELPFPSPEITLDELGRVQELTYQYQSITVNFDVTWTGDTNTISTYTKTIQDN